MIGIIEDIPEGSALEPKKEFKHYFTLNGGRSIKVNLDLQKFVFQTIPYGQTKPKRTVINKGNWRFCLEVNEKFKAIQ